MTLDEVSLMNCNRVPIEQLRSLIALIDLNDILDGDVWVQADQGFVEYQNAAGEKVRKHL